MKTAIITGEDISNLLDKLVILQDENKRLTEQVAATEAATARKCAEIAGILPESEWIVREIRAAFPKAFAQEEGR